MVETKTKTTAARAKIAHKLARYYRATPVHHTGTAHAANGPSTSHLSNCFVTQPSVVPPREESETRLTPGTLLTTRKIILKEPARNPSPLKADNPSPPEPSSFSFPVSAEAEESLSSKPSPQATFWSLDPTPSMVSLLEESTPPT